MFIKLTRNGPRTYLQIAESFRDPKTGKPRQRHVANLGRLDRLVTGGDLNSLIEGLLQATGQAKLGTWTQALEADDTTFETAQPFGSTWAVWMIWKQLKIDQFLNRSSRFLACSESFEQLIRVLVTNRLCAGHYGGGFFDWMDRVYLANIEREKLIHRNFENSLYSISSMKGALERYLASVHPQGKIADTIFYGIVPLRMHASSDLTHCDNSGEGMLDVVGVALTPEGLPVQHDIPQGPINVPTTLREITGKLRAKFPSKRLIFLSDLDLLSLDTLEALKDLKLPGKQALEYIVSIPPMRFEELTASIVTSPQWEATSRAQSGEVIESVTLTAGRRLMMARYPAEIRHARKQRVKRLSPVVKLAGMLERQLVAQDEKIGHQGPQLTDAAAKLMLNQAIVEARASRLIHIDQDEPAFAWWWDINALKREMALDGTLILVSNVPDMAAPDVVSQFNRLADIETCFSLSKHQLEIASLDRRRKTRLQQHAMIGYLVYFLHRLMRMRLTRKGYDLSPEQLLERLELVQCHSVQLPKGRQFNTVTHIDATLRALFEALDIDPPTRERILRR